MTRSAVHHYCHIRSPSSCSGAIVLVDVTCAWPRSAVYGEEMGLLWCFLFLLFFFVLLPSPPPFLCSVTQVCLLGFICIFGRTNHLVILGYVTHFHVCVCICMYVFVCICMRVLPFLPFLPFTLPSPSLHPSTKTAWRMFS